MAFKFIIYKVNNGYLLNVYSANNKNAISYVFTDKERMTILAMVDKLLGEEPEGSKGMEKKQMTMDCFDGAIYKDMEDQKRSRPTRNYGICFC